MGSTPASAAPTPSAAGAAAGPAAAFGYRPATPASRPLFANNAGAGAGASPAMSPLVSPAATNANTAASATAASAAALGALTLPNKPPAVASSKYWVAELLVDHIIMKINDGRSPVESIFSEPGYKPQVDALFAFVNPDSTIPGAPNAVHASAIRAQLTTKYLDEYSTLAIADVVKKWLGAAAPIFAESAFSDAARVANGGDKVSGLAGLISRLEMPAQAILAQIMRMCLAITQAEARTKISRARLAHVLGPAVFRSPMDIDALKNVKNVNSLLEDMIANASTLCAAGAQALNGGVAVGAGAGGAPQMPGGAPPRMMMGGRY